MNTPFPIPGWYPDPVEPRWLRWWDGAAWTAHLVPRTTGDGAQFGAGGAYASETKIAPWAKAATIVYPVLSVAIGVVSLATSGAWKAYFHSVRVMFNSLGTPGPLPRPAHVPEWANLFTPFTLAAEVMFWIWQYRAATTARRLGYPAKRSPGLGVGSYFIPIVQFWFPYQALRDCLPPGSEHRGRVLRVWLLLLATGVINASLVVLFAEAPPVGVAVFAVSVVLAAVLAVNGFRMVESITTAHSRAQPGRSV